MMLSICRSLIKPHRAMSRVAARSRRNLVLTSKACEDDLATARPAVREPRDSLKSSISRSESMEQLQSVIQQHLPVMSTKHLQDCMFHAMNLARREEAKFSAADDPSFQMLAGTVLLKLRFFSLDQCVNLAKVVAHLKLDCSSSLVQGIYQMLRQRLNDLDLEQIMILRRSSDLLQGTSPLIDALTLSLPLVFETQVERQLDTTNERMCLRALKFAASANVSRDAQEFVAAAARKFLLQASPQVATDIIYAVAFQEPRLETPRGPKMQRALRDCLAIIAENLSRFDSKSVRRIMAAYKNLDISQGKLHVALWALAPAWTFSEIMILVHLSLAKDAITWKDVDILKDCLLTHKQELTTKAHHQDILDCAHVMSLQAARMPGPSAEFEEIGLLLTTALERQRAIQQTPGLLTRFMLDLALLGVYPERELGLLFSEEHQEGLLNDTLPDLLRLFDLERLLRLHFGESCKYVVSPKLKEKAAELRAPTYLAEDLVSCLQNAVGGEQFVLERLVTPMGVDVDLAVVLGEDGTPFAMDKKKSPFEGLPENCRVVAILQCVEWRDSCRNSPLLKVPFLLRERFLRAENICTVPIMMSAWKKLTSIERISFLRRSIKEASREARTN